MLKGTKAPTTKRLAGGLAAGVLLAAAIGVGGLHAQEQNPDWLDWQKRNGVTDTTGSTNSGSSASGAVQTQELGGTGADTQSRLLQLEDQVRSLTGRLDEMSHRLSETNQQLEQLQKNMDLRLSKLEGGSSAMSGAGASTGAAANAGGRTSTSPTSTGPESTSRVLGTMPADTNVSGGSSSSGGGTGPPSNISRRTQWVA